MKRLLSSLLLATVTVLGFSAISTESASGQERFSPGAFTQFPQQNGIRLGFNGNFIGYGIQVLGVQPYSTADRMGLEPGDVVIAVNGVRIQSYGHYLALINSTGGFVQLHVQDVRTGSTVVTSARVPAPPMACAPQMP